MILLSPVKRFLLRNSTTILLMIIALFFGSSMILTVANSASSRQAAINAKIAAADTRTLVKGQTAVLAAIKQATEDNSTTATQKTNIIICMLQVPQAERIPKESDCRRQAVSSDTSSKTSQGTSTAGSKTSGVSSSSNNGSKSTTPQGNNSQGNGGTPPPNNTSPLINLTSPLPNACIKLKPLFSVC